MMGRPKLVDKAKKMVVYMDQEIENRIKEDAKDQDISPSQLVRKILKEYYTNK